MRAFILLFIISLTACTTPKKTIDFIWPEHEITPIYKEFLQAYNTNDLKRLQTFTTKYYETLNKKNAAYWPSVFADFGEIIPFSVSKKWSNKNKLSIWFQGKHTKGWVMIQLRMNKENTKIIGKGVIRGMRPPGQLPSYKHISQKKLNPYLKKYIDKLAELDRFSGSVLVAKGNSILFEKTYGVSNKKTRVKNDANTSFNIASTTKTFTAVSIAKLVEQGKLKYTDTISKFIPEYPKDIADQVTIHHLLTHTSGIELDDHAPFNLENSRAKNMNDLVMAQIKHIDSMNENRRPNFKVLNKFDYSNENFALLGAIIERASGMSYGDYINQNIFVPLNMKDSFADISKLSKHTNKAIGYTYKNENSEFVGDERRENDKTNGTFIGPAGGIYSSAKDLLSYFKAINNHSLVNKQTQKALHKKQAKNYGYGFYISDTSIGHGGVYPGVGSRFTYYPKTDYYVIVLSNYGSMAGSVIADHIEDILPQLNE